MCRPSQLPGRALVISGELQARGNSISYVWLERSPGPPPPRLGPEGHPGLDSVHTLSWFVSYRLRTPKFQHFLYAVSLLLYLWASSPFSKYWNTVRGGGGGGGRPLTPLDEQNMESRDIVCNCGSRGTLCEKLPSTFTSRCFGAEFVFNYGYWHFHHMHF